VSPQCREPLAQLTLLGESEPGRTGSGVGGRDREGGVELVLVEAAEQGGRGAVRVDDDEGRLDRDAEVLEELAVAVGELRERELMAVDEASERSFVTGPCDAVGDDLAVPASGDQFDRTGFGVADRSSRRPEPQHDGLPRQRGAVELAAAEELPAERERPLAGRCLRRRPVG
jgi:hypothetical protein